MTTGEQANEMENIENMMILHPNVNEDVEIMEPITIEQIEKTKQILENKNFSLTCNDPNAIYHIMNKIAENHGLGFVIINSNEKRKRKDSTEKPVDFALENQVITEDSFFMFGSENLEHQIKGFSLHLKGSPLDLPNDFDNMQSYIHLIKEKLSAIHGVSLESIIINSITEGSIKINYTVKDLSKIKIHELSSDFPQEFNTYKSHDIHASFLIMEIDYNTFSPILPIQISRKRKERRTTI
jgi:hypothetical protein